MVVGRGLACLQAYKQEHGDCLVPIMYKTTDKYALGKWVSNQRSAYKKGTLRQSAVAQLEALGFQWSPRNFHRGKNKTKGRCVAPMNCKAMQWEEGFARLQTYFKEHGDCLTSHRYRTEDGYALGRWVATQRATYKGASRTRWLSASRVARLEALGFVWDGNHRNVKWAEVCLRDM